MIENPLTPERLFLPAIAAPMFLVSGPALVIEACRNGVIGAFPALNQRSSGGLEDWLDQIAAGLASGPASGVSHLAPYAVNLIVHKTNTRLEADLKVLISRRTPIVITSLGAIKEVVDAVHEYGGIVFHDVTTMRYAHKALETGVDGLIAVCAGAGGHAGALNPFAFVQELRQATDRTIILAGAISNGAHIAAAIAAGADLVSIGTRFIATRESLAVEEYKKMILRSTAADIIYTPKISGVNANFLAESIRKSGIDLEAPGHERAFDVVTELGDQAKAWRDIWSAGQGVGGLHDVPFSRELIHRMRAEFCAAAARLQTIA